MERSCGACGESVDHLGPRARYCDSSCRATATKRRAKRIPEARLAVVAPVESGVLAATRAELEAADRVSTSLGAKALALASRIDAQVDTGSALAALVKQHDVTMAEAVKGAHIKASPLDELRARRDRKHA